MQDNLKTVQMAVYLAIPREGLKASKLAELEDVVAGVREPSDFMYFDYRSEQEINGSFAEAEATLSVSFHGEHDRERYEDNQGNYWRKFVPEVKISWPSWGSASVAHADFRLDVMNRVRDIARAVQGMVDTQEIWSIVSTKAERDESARMQVEATQKAIVWGMCRSQTQHLRVGMTREYGDIVKRPLPASIKLSHVYTNVQVPAGSSIRTFNVVVTVTADMPSVVTITRVA